MTEKRMRQLAEQARERHKNDPRWNPSLTESDRFWRDWAGWMYKSATMGAVESLSYRGKNDPTANAAIGSADWESTGSQEGGMA